MQQPTTAAVVTQLRAFSGELNGIAFLHSGAKDVSGIARAADEIAQRISTMDVAVDMTFAVRGLIDRVRAMAGDNRDPVCAARLWVAASVMSAFIQNATDH
jgi:hypothetical protein